MGPALPAAATAFVSRLQVEAAEPQGIPLTLRPSVFKPDRNGCCAFWFTRATIGEFRIVNRTVGW